MRYLPINMDDAGTGGMRERRLKTRTEGAA